MERHTMSCVRCDELLKDYRDAVGLFKDAVNKVEVVPVRDNRLSARRAARLLAAGRAVRWGEICKYASDALIEHWRNEHPGLAEKQGLQ
jgi:hypothetical protein